MLVRPFWLSSALAVTLGLSLGCSANNASRPGPTVTTSVLLPPTIVEPSASLPVYVEDLNLGSRAAPVTVVAFLDLECPYCTQGLDTVWQVAQKFGEERVQLVIKHLPLDMHRHARRASELSLDLLRSHGQKAAWAFVRQVLARQTELDESALLLWQQDIVSRFPKTTELGFTLSVSDQLNRDTSLAYQLGINQTPSFRINGLAIDGAASTEQFTQAIEGELEATQVLLKHAVPEGALYARRVQENLKPIVAQVEEAAPPDNRVWAIPVGNSPVLGDKAAEVTLVAFMDLECPYCGQAFETLLTLAKKYEGHLRIVWKHRPLPFHAQAESAAQLLEDVRAQRGVNEFFSTAKELFSHQEQYGDAYFERVAGGLGIKRHSTVQPVSPTLVAQDVHLAEDFGVTSTPQFFLNGRRIEGSRSLADFSSRIDAELVAAEASK